MISEPTHKSKIRPLRDAFTLPPFMRKRAFRKWAFLVGLSSLLMLLFIPELNLHRPNLKPGMVLDNDIRADHDFLVEDKGATEKKRMEAAFSVEPVFDYDRDIPASIGMRLAKAFSALEEKYYRDDGERASLMSHEELIGMIKKDFEQAANVNLSARELEILHKNRFSFSICSNIVQLLNTAYKADIMSHEEFLRISKQQKSIIVRDIKTHEEDRKNILSILDVREVESYFEKASRMIFGKSNEALREISVSLAAKTIQPNLTYNKSATEKRRRLMLNNVKPVYYRVYKNELLARAGEPLTVADVARLEAFYKSSEGGRFAVTTFFGFFFTIMLLLLIFYDISRSLMKEIDSSVKNILFLTVVFVLQVLLVKAGIFISESIGQAFSFLMPEMTHFAVPFAVSTLLVAVFLNRHVAFCYSIFSAVLITFLFPDKLPMFLFAFLGSAVSSYHINYFKQRSAFFKSGLIAAGVNVIVILCLSLITGNLSFTDTLIKMFMGALGGMLSGIIVAGITPLFEALFGYTTDIKLLELANLNQPLLQRLIVEAPGTYHHSIVVASMVEAAAEAINANSLLSKVSAYYHDIGKLTKPLYFIENQQGWKNKHDKLSPKMSSLVIISHVKDGCELAQKYKLGQAITDIIRQHHGMSIVGYFYEKAQKDKDPSIRSIPESDFRYPGPKPQTKEAGLVMLGDVIEASSRTLSDPTPSRIRNLVQSRVKQIFADGQLEECELTLNDVNRISESFVRTLTGIFHQRIEYTEPAAKSAGKRENNGCSDHKSAEKNRSRC